MRALLVCLTAGLVWQFVLVVGLVWFEQRSLRWSTVRDALWLRAPRNPKSGKRGGKMWWIVLPLIVALAAEEMIPTFTQPANRDFGTFIGSKAGHVFMHGSWGWFALILVEMIFNTVLGEELLFRGFLLPRMNGAFGDRDWVANGVLFAGYHLHEPWVIVPTVLVDTFVSRARRSAIGARGSALPSTAPKASCSPSFCSTLVFKQRRQAMIVDRRVSDRRSDPIGHASYAFLPPAVDCQTGGLRFGLLGPLEVSDDTGPIALGQPRQRAVLALGCCSTPTMSCQSSAS